MKRIGGLTVLVAGIGVTLGGCRDGGLAPGDTPDAGLAMTYAEGGTYQASGLPAFEGSQVAPGTFAVAFPDSAFPDSIGGLLMAGFSQTSGTRGDLFILQLVELRTGDFGPCSYLVGSSGCHGRLLEDIDAANLQDLGRPWEIDGGSVHMAVAGPDRVTGSFSGLVLRSTDGATRTIESGSFDLPLLSGEEGADIMRCFLARVTGAPSC